MGTNSEKGNSEHFQLIQQLEKGDALMRGSERVKGIVQELQGTDQSRSRSFALIPS
jgi:hypothetical protein